MEILCSTSDAVRKTLWIMPHEKVRQLERALRWLNAEQSLFLRETLEHASRVEGAASDGHLHILKHCLGEWQTYNLTIKLAVICCVTALPNSVAWPDRTPADRTVHQVMAALASMGIPSTRPWGPSVHGSGEPQADGQRALAMTGGGESFDGTTAPAHSS
ncbi:MAG: hypothetical protein GY842_18070 [bacterium]|nr:hypothetical protein [bacterium]